MFRKRLWLLLCLLPLFQLLQPTKTTAQTAVLIHPGDQWRTLAWRFGVDETALRQQAGEINPYRQPAMGSELLLGATVAQSGTAVFLNGESLLRTAVSHNVPLHQLASQNNIQNPYAPHVGTIFVPQPESVPRILPPAFDSLELSQMPATPGQAVGWRGQIREGSGVAGWLNGRSITTATSGSRALGLTGTGAFQGSGNLRLDIQTNDGFWSQPWRFQDTTDWAFQQLTLTGDAALIDQEAINAERARLFELWEQATPQPLFDGAFQTPVDSFLTISSSYGARRSYNGGPYRTYHEGVDYAAYGGTAVTAPASGTVIVSEFLYVRGGAVIIDHGLGIYSGYYHLSSLAVEAGQTVQTGTLLGEVGTTGLSTGNHLHWDLLVNAVWVDALAWQEQQMASWILTGWRGE